MSVLNEIFEENEISSREHDRIICEEILKELQNIYRIPFVGFKNQSPISNVMSFFTNPRRAIFRKAVYELMEKYHVNKRAFLFRLLTEIYPPDFYPQLQKLPTCLNLKKEDEHYEVTTSFGILKLYRLTDKIQAEDVKFTLKREDMHRYCHASVATFASSFQDDLITTSKLRGLFGGVRYHSYMVCKDGSGVMDFTRNTFFSGTCFDDIFKPEVVAQYQACELENRFETYKRENPSLVNDYYPVFQLALKEEIKKYRAKK